MRRILASILLLFVLAMAAYAPLLKPFRGFIPLNHSQPSARGLVGCWLMNEGGGRKVCDLSGNGNQGTFNNGPIWIPGAFGSSVDFADNQCVDVPQVLSSVYPSTTIIIGRLNSVNSGEYVSNRAVSIYTTQEGYSCIGIGISQAQKPAIFTTEGDDPKEVEGSTVITLGKTIMLTHVEEAGSNKIYLNGRLDGSASWTNTQTPGVGNIQFASGNRTSNIRQWDGQLELVMIFNRALSASEIGELYRNPFGMWESSFDLILYGALGG